MSRFRLLSAKALSAITLSAIALAASPLLAVRPLSAQVTPPAAPAVSARIIGVTFDSTTMRPLQGAIVQLVAANNPAQVRSANADDRGAFEFEGVGAGTYLLGFLHARLDTLGVEAPLIRVDVRIGGEIRVPMSIPSGRTLVARLCGPEMARDSMGVYVGFVRSARGEPISGPARIRAQWVEVTLGPKGIERHMPSHFATSTATGSFALCGIPLDGTFLVRAFVGPDSSGFVELEGSRNRLISRDIYVGGATKVAAKAGGAPILRGSGALKGVVRAANGSPLRDARLVLWGSGREDTTNVSGQFNMQSLPTGTYSLEARAIGFLPKRVPIDVPDSSLTVAAADLTLEAFAPSLDTMRIRADRIQKLNALADFEKRRKMGGGYFINEAQLTNRKPMFMSDIFRMVPGTSITAGNDLAGDKILMRGLAGSGSCVPDVYINGIIAVNVDGNIDDLVNPQQVRAVEVYTRTASVPVQFQSQRGCGSVVIWTGYRGP